MAAGCSATSPAASPPVVTTPAPGALSLLVEPDQGIEPVYRLIASARQSIDVTMYELADPVATQALEVAAGRGVAVRVILDKNRERAANQSTFDDLRAHGVNVVWAAERFAATHEKAIVVDRRAVAIMSLNLTSRYYDDTRDFAVLDSQPRDVAAIEEIFDADFRHTSTTPAVGTDLVWSPGSRNAVIDLIDSAATSLLVENEEMGLSEVTKALERAARRGVQVTVVMTEQADWAGAFAELVAAGVAVRTYSPNATLYIHAKAIVVDAQTPRARAFVGSENFSAASLQRNRELGIETADPGVVAAVARTIRTDAANARPWQPVKGAAER